MARALLGAQAGTWEGRGPKGRGRTLRVCVFARPLRPDGAHPLGSAGLDACTAGLSSGL